MSKAKERVAKDKANFLALELVPQGMNRTELVQRAYMRGRADTLREVLEWADTNEWQEVYGGTDVVSLDDLKKFAGGDGE